MDLSWYLQLVRSRWILLVAPVVLGAVIGVASWSISNSVTGSTSYYRATRILIFRPPANGSTWAFQNPDEIALLATQGDVPRRVDKAHGDGAGNLTDRVVTRSDESTRSLEITVVGRNAKGTEELTDALADALRVAVADEEQARFVVDRDTVVARLQTLTDELAQLDSQLETASGTDRDLLRAQRQGTLNEYLFTYEQFRQFTAEGNPSERLSTLDDAVAVPISAGDYDAVLDLVADRDNNLRVDRDQSQAELPTGSGWRDSALLRGFLGGLLGLFVGLGLTFGADQIRPRLRTRADVEAVFDAPVLTDIPRLSRKEQRDGDVVSATTSRSRAAEAYRALRARILRRVERHTDDPRIVDQRWQRPGLVIMVTSASPGEGKTTTTANLAVVFAEAGASVLAVSCDRHRPRLGVLLGASGSAREITDTAIDGVRCVTTVVDDPAVPPPRAVARQRELVEGARESFDVVLLDTAPLVTTNDTTDLLQSVDVVVLVARIGTTTFHAATQARQLLEQFGASVAGVALLDPYLNSKDPYYENTTQMSDVERADLTRRGSRDPGSSAHDVVSDVAPLNR